MRADWLKFSILRIVNALPADTKVGENPARDFSWEPLGAS